MRSGRTLVKVRRTSISGLLIVDLDLHEDHRGWFKENWQREKMIVAGLPDFQPVQNNISFNVKKGVTRGMHAEPWDKYISVASGAVYGAWIDLREGSATFGQDFSLEITPGTAVYVPRGVANGFQALEENTAYTYLVNEHWSPEAEYSFTNLDQINWPLTPTELSEKDRLHPRLEEAKPVKKKKVLVTGANGQLGRALREVHSDFEFVNRDEFDVVSPSGRNWSDYRAIVNCAAYTDVDGAEVDVESAWRVNALAPAELARIAREHRLSLVHISTDYVFNGDKQTPYRIEDAISPISVYGASKAAGELAVLSNSGNYLIRTSWVVGDGNNFVRTMMDLAGRGVSPKVVNDQIGRPTFAPDLARFIVKIIEETPPPGIYHFSNSGPSVSWFDLAKEVYSLSGVDERNVKPVSTSEYYAGKSVAARPLYSVFDLEKAEEVMGEVPTWQQSLSDYVAREQQR